MRTIVWDVDDVLNDLTRVWLETAWLPAHPLRSLHYQDLRANPPLAALGVSLAEYLESLDQFRQSSYLERLEPLPEALHWFRAHGERYRHLALTSAPLSCASISAAWVFRHYGAWIRTFHVVPSARNGERHPVYDLTKTEFLQWLGKPELLLVDDRPENVAQAKDLGWATITLPRPWNGASGSVADAFQQIGAWA
jgi:hypothetical protein